MARLLRQSLCYSMLLVLVPALVGAQDTGRWATPADFMKATGNTIAAFGEAPMLQEMVAQGLLPPVAERLPDEPLVVRGADGVGTYGGRLRLVAQGPVPPPFNPGMVDTMMAEHDFGVGLHPNVG
jgi:hypothetical protein